MNFLSNSSSTLTSNNFEILANASMSGCDEFVHHLETGDGLTPNASDSHLLVFFCSTRTCFKQIRLVCLSDLLLGCKVSENISIFNIHYFFFPHLAFYLRAFCVNRRDLLVCYEFFS